MIKNAIIEWEPRVIIEAVGVTENRDGSGWLDISIDYRVRQTNTRSNLVFPFYTLNRRSRRRSDEFRRGVPRRCVQPAAGGKAA